MSLYVKLPSISTLKFRSFVELEQVKLSVGVGFDVGVFEGVGVVEDEFGGGDVEDFGVVVG